MTTTNDYTTINDYCKEKDTMAITNPVKAIRVKCLDCCYDSTKEIELCPVTDCALHPFRMGKNPYRTKRKMTEEQRQQARERLAKINAKCTEK